MLNSDKDISFALLKSALTVDGAFYSAADVINWMSEQNKQIKVCVSKTKFSKMENWISDDNAIRHKSGRFFGIEGINVKTDWGFVHEWDQPIINQPEIGYLGILCKEFDNVLYFLLQAKVEPGNINYVQLAPTLQATKSNYMQIHAGKKPKYLEYFQNADPKNILLDQLQSEQGGRFLRKRNRNMIVKCDAEVIVGEHFIWLTLGQIKCLMKNNNLINMDTRTVISGIDFGSYPAVVAESFTFFEYHNCSCSFSRAMLKSMLTCDVAYNSIDFIISYLTKRKSNFDLNISPLMLAKVKDWIYTDQEIYHRSLNFFKVIAVDVRISNREVSCWSQPLLEPSYEGLCAFVCKEISGILHFAVQLKLECGNFDVLEFAPTVQCLTGNYRNTEAGTLPFLDYVLNAKKEQIVYDVYQSEEGGRFFREQNRNCIVIADKDIPIDLPENFIWLTLNQIQTFLKFNNYLNIQARSLISAISFTE